MSKFIINCLFDYNHPTVCDAVSHFIFFSSAASVIGDEWQVDVFGILKSSLEKCLLKDFAHF